MWNNQGQGGYGADQGGGYLNSPSQFGGTPGGGEKKTQQQHAKNLVPCTVAQVLASKQVDDKFMVDNIELYQVTLLGLVRTVSESATRVEFTLDDMTGPPIEVRQFVETDENNPDEVLTTPIRENTYVRVFGHVRSFQQKHSIMAFKVRPMTDPNEITTHILEVIKAHIELTRGSFGAPAGAQTSYNNANGSNVSMSGGYQALQPDQGLNPVQAQILSVIQSCPDEEGISIGNICSNARGLPQKAVRDAVEFLSTEGHIYSTIDDDHFKSTESI